MEFVKQPILKTTEFLRKYGLKALEEKHSILAKRHSKYPNLVQLRYEQLESDMSDAMVQECRGLLLDEKDDWRVLSFPYMKFFNYNETNAAKIDWSSSKVYEKMDGSLAILYWYDGQWHIASSGRPDAVGYLNKSKGKPWEDLKFKDIFWEIWKNLNYKFPEETNKCFMFELFSYRNPVVVVPKEENILLHGVRNLDDFKEEEPEFSASKYGWNLVPVSTRNFKSLEDVVAAAKKLDPGRSEGFVVCDGNFNRVKVKSPQYVCMSLMSWKDKDGLNKRRMLEIVRNNEGDEFLSYFPQWKGLYIHLKLQYDELVSKAEKLYEEIMSDPEKVKDFGRAVAKLDAGLIQNALFSVKKGNTIRGYFASVDVKKLESLLPKTEISTLPTKAENGNELIWKEEEEVEEEQPL